MPNMHGHDFGMHTPFLLLLQCSVVGHFSPLNDDATTLKNGDVVKM